MPVQLSLSKKQLSSEETNQSYAGNQLSPVLLALISRALREKAKVNSAPSPPKITYFYAKRHIPGMKESLHLGDIFQGSVIMRPTQYHFQFLNIHGGVPIILAMVS